ncbi:MAG TPA: MMPL family transporter [Kineosporiaceae bacterium]
MPAWICTTCGVRQADRPEPPAGCAICADERQAVGWGGQAWTTLAELARDHATVLREEEPGRAGSSSPTAPPRSDAPPTATSPGLGESAPGGELCPSGEGRGPGCGEVLHIPGRTTPVHRGLKWSRGVPAAGARWWWCWRASAAEERSGMARFLYRVGRFSQRRPWPVIGLWLTLVALTLTGATVLKAPLSNQLRIPGAGFQVVTDTLRAELPAASGELGTIVVTSSSPFTPDQRQAVATASAGWARVDGVAAVIDPFTTQSQFDGAAAKVSTGRAQLDAATAQLSAGQGQVAAGTAQLDQAQRAVDAQRAALPPGAPLPEQLAVLQRRIDEGRAQVAAQQPKLAAAQQTLAEQGRQLRIGERRTALIRGTRLVSADGRTALVQLRLTGQANALTTSARDRIQRIGAELARSGVRVDYASSLVGDLNSVIGPTEIAGVGVAAVVLLVMLGTLVAAGLPLALALVGVAVGIGATLSASRGIEMNSVTPALALMLGLAVGIDYSLFIINRHRRQLLAGMPVPESIARANGTSGNAVVFAGLTVIIALAALTVVGIPFLAVMGVAAAVTVAVAVAVAVTLTPAVLALVGQRVVSRRAWLAARPPAQDDATAPARRRPAWGELVTGRPWAWAAAAVLLLAVCAVPAADLRLGLPDGGSEPLGSTAYRAYTLTARSFGEGANGPIVAVATLPPGLDATAAEERELDVAELIAMIRGVVRVVPLGISTDRRVAAMQIVPQRGPGAAQTVDLVQTLRLTAGAIKTETGADVGLTGQTVANIDISARLAGTLGPYLAVVVGLSLLIMIMAFRSVPVPLVATGGFLLSLGASFGAVVAVYQWGWLKEAFGVSSPGSVQPFLPTLLVGVLFGLAMDYQMFLVSGMREAYAHGEEARHAVLTGFRHGWRVVTAAALIMVSVFAGFIRAELTTIRPIGFGLAFGVLVDAFVVRMTLTPAVLRLLGARAWSLPRWLDRVLPHVDVEGALLAASSGVRSPGGEPESDGSRRPGEVATPVMTPS